MSDFRWRTSEDATFYLSLAETDGKTPVTGSDPIISVRRHRDLAGNLLDNYYWDNTSSFTASAEFHSMTEIDSTNSPGLYSYFFNQSLAAQPYIYNIYFSSSLGFAIETHVFEEGVLQIFSGDLVLYESEPDPSR